VLKVGNNISKCSYGANHPKKGLQIVRLWKLKGIIGNRICFAGNSDSSSILKLSNERNSEIIIKCLSQCGKETRFN